MSESMTRRTVLTDAGIAAGALVALGCQATAQSPETMTPAGAAAMPMAAATAKPYTLPPLPYAYDALAPYIDEQTLRLHHDKHHAGYVKGLNAALGRLAAARAAGDYGMVKHWSADVAFHGAGHVLHWLYWANMKPGGGGKPGGALAAKLDADFGSFDGFTQTYATVTKTVAGSGWGVLAYEGVGGRLIVTGVEKHENVDIPGAVPLLICDVWEHAYYLRYQNRRADYVSAFLAHLVNWDVVAQRLAAVTKMA